MIFVTLGNHNQPFDRLLSWIDALAKGRFSAETFLVQRGYTDYDPDGAETVRFLERDAYLDKMRDSDAVVAHGGSGALTSALRFGTPVIAVPRRAREGEHVDDHQLELCRALRDRGTIRIAETREALAEHLDDVLSPGATSLGWEADNRRMEEILEDFLSDVTDEGAPTRGSDSSQVTGPRDLPPRGMSRV